MIVIQSADCKVDDSDLLLDNMTKKKLIIKLVLIVFSINCFGQNRDTAQKLLLINCHPDSICFEGELNQYKVDTCLYGLFKEIIRADRKVSKLIPDFLFYSVTFKLNEEYRYLDISTERWNKSAFLDYTGIIVIDGVSFLCRGDFENDFLFQKVNANKIKVNLRKPKVFGTDSLDLKYVPLIYDKSFYGTYNECKGLPVYMDIFIKGEIKGFKMYLKKNNNDRRPISQ